MSGVSFASRCRCSRHDADEQSTIVYRDILLFRRSAVSWDADPNREGIAPPQDLVGQIYDHLLSGLSAGNSFRGPEVRRQLPFPNVTSTRSVVSDFFNTGDVR